MCNLVVVNGPHLVCIEWLLPLLLLVGWSLLLLILLCPNHWWGIQPWGLHRESPNPSTFPMWWGGVFFSRFGAIRWCSRFWFCYGHYTWWILVWWLGIRLMSLLAPGLQSSLWPAPTFILGFTGKGFIINPVSSGTRVWGLCLFGSDCCWLWNKDWILSSLIH